MLSACCRHANATQASVSGTGRPGDCHCVCSPCWCYGSALDVHTTCSRHSVFLPRSALLTQSCRSATSRRHTSIAFGHHCRHEHAVSTGKVALGWAQVQLLVPQALPPLMLAGPAHAPLLDMAMIKQSRASLLATGFRMGHQQPTTRQAWHCRRRFVCGPTSPSTVLSLWDQVPS